MLKSLLFYLSSIDLLYRIPHSSYQMQRRTCVVCHEKHYMNVMHRFTRVDSKQQVWIKAVRSTNEGRRSLTGVLAAHRNPFLCASHFSPSDFVQSSGSVTLRPDAVPFFHVSVVQCMIEKTFYYQTTTNKCTSGPGNNSHRSPGYRHYRA